MDEDVVLFKDWFWLMGCHYAQSVSFLQFAYSPVGKSLPVTEPVHQSSSHPGDSGWGHEGRRCSKSWWFPDGSSDCLAWEENTHTHIQKKKKEEEEEGVWKRMEGGGNMKVQAVNEGMILHIKLLCGMWREQFFVMIVNDSDWIAWDSLTRRVCVDLCERICV